MSTQDNRVLLHVLKHNPQDGEVYFTWEGETFVGSITGISVERCAGSLTNVEISAVMLDNG